MSLKEEFVEIYTSKIQRDGADKLLEYLMTSDFFTAPASTRFHGAYEGGLVEHSLNVYKCLVDYLSRPRVKQLYGMEYSEESVAIVALLHDLCKVGCYVPGTRNVKKDGQWVQVPTYEFRDSLPYGHGEKSVYIISGFMRLTREEAFAVRYHMGFAENANNINNIGASFEQFPLAFALCTSDMEATYFLEGKLK